MNGIGREGVGGPWQRMVRGGGGACTEVGREGAKGVTDDNCVVVMEVVYGW
jgi:hypothetical protein